MHFQFVKMHGVGNDYIYLDGTTGQELPKDLPTLARWATDRHKGIGGDGLVLMLPSAIADCRMLMFNADGSEGLMCGNAIRCIAKLAQDRGFIKCPNLTVETASGIKRLHILTNTADRAMVSVEMGTASLQCADLPMRTNDATYINKPIEAVNATWRITAVSMGNPHAVIFCNTPIADMDIATVGHAIETLPLFPKRTNVEFVNIINATHLNMRVWERGSGETLACGTGACAAVVAATANRLLKPDTDITLRLRGGTLQVRCTADYNVTLCGEAVKVFEGNVAFKEPATTQQK